MSQPKWEYKIVSLSTVEEAPDMPNATRTLNAFGSDGWEVVAVVRGHSSNYFEVFLKRRADLI